MADWQLYFLQSQPVSIDACAHALASVVGGPGAIVAGPWSGNPRDFYDRSIEIRARSPDGALALELSLMQSARTHDDPEAILQPGLSLTLRAPAATFARKLATWHALRDALAAIGCTDLTLARSPAPIPDDAEAAGEAQTASRLRAEIAAAAIADRQPRSAAVLVDPVDGEPRRPSAADVPPARTPRVVQFRSGVLDLSDRVSSADEIRALVEGGAYRSAVKLVLSHNRIGDAGIAHLARSGGFPSLTSLDLADTGLTDLGTRALAEHAVALDQLAELVLGDVADAARGTGVSDAAVAALVRSPRLPALRTVTRYHEHRQSANGREGREVTAIERADGSAVASIVVHSIWP